MSRSKNALDLDLELEAQLPDNIHNMHNDHRQCKPKPVQRQEEDDIMRCLVCQEKVYPLEMHSVDAKIYHKNCFRCYKCKNFAGAEFVMNNGQIYCKVHFMELFKKRGRYDEDESILANRDDEDEEGLNETDELPPADLTKSLLAQFRALEADSGSARNPGNAPLKTSAPSNSRNRSPAPPANRGSTPGSNAGRAPVAAGRASTVASSKGPAAPNSRAPTNSRSPNPANSRQQPVASNTKTAPEKKTTRGGDQSSGSRPGKSAAQESEEYRENPDLVKNSTTTEILEEELPAPDTAKNMTAIWKNMEKDATFKDPPTPYTAELRRRSQFDGVQTFTSSNIRLPPGSPTERKGFFDHRGWDESGAGSNSPNQKKVSYPNDEEITRNQIGEIREEELPESGLMSSLRSKFENPR